MIRKLLIALTTATIFALTISAGAQATVPAHAAHAGQRRQATARTHAHRGSRRRRSHRVNAKPRRPSSAVHARHLHAQVATVDHHSGNLQTSAIGAYSVQVTWPVVAGAATVAVYVNDVLTDRFPSTADNSYVVHNLWPRTTFTVAISLLSSSGAQIERIAGQITTARPTSAFPRLYAANAFINAPVSSSPSLDSNSSNIVSSSLAAYASNSHLSNDNAWGVPIVTADNQSDGYNVGCQYYWCNMNFGNVQIPSNAQANTGSDGHLVVMQPDGNEMDMWIGQHTNSGWTSGSRWLESASGPAANCTTAHGCGGADAANFALAAGVVRPEEIAQGHIDHALALITPDTRQGYAACPATSTDGQQTSPNSLPIGAHIQLSPSINVASLNIPSWQKVIAVALQQYGAYVVDTGGSLEIRGESNLGRTYDAWAKAGVPSNAPSLSGLPWGSMRVLSMTQCA
jgi:hypothetical protein